MKLKASYLGEWVAEARKQIINSENYAVAKHRVLQALCTLTHFFTAHSVR